MWFAAKKALFSAIARLGLNLIKKGNALFLVLLALILIALSWALAVMFSPRTALEVVGPLLVFMFVLGQSFKKILNMQVAPLAERGALNVAAVESLAGELAGLGFVPAGFFTVTAGVKAALEGWVHPYYKVSAVITEAGRKVPPFVDMQCEYADGSSFEITSRKEETGLPRPANMVQVCLEGAGPTQLLTAILDRRPPGGLLEIRPEDFLSYYQGELDFIREFLLEK
ncbi:hypothetical protein LJB99_06900 [Deltaproteobacteria bacterium OttesenSCG-928-K17]|nr:hypothetical protein [Deltaproteobacteria bacterium OttesenSCG-928-K17]